MYLFLRLVLNSYERFIAKLSTDAQEPLVIVRRGHLQTDLNGENVAADNAHNQSSERAVA